MPTRKSLSWWPLAAALLFAPLGATPSLAGDGGEDIAEPAPHAGLAGTWLLDKEASDDIDPLLGALGRSAMKRMMARKLKKITHVVAVAPGWIDVEIHAGPVTATSHLEFGVPSETFIVGGSAIVTSELVDGAVVSAGELDVDGVTVVFRSHRSLVDADTTALVMSVEQPGEPTVTVRRVFRRQP